MHANPSTSVICTPLLSPRDCDALAAALDPDGWSPGRIAHTDGNRAEALIRSCSLNHRVPAPWLERLEAAVRHWNEQLFGFELDPTVRPEDPFTAMRYRPGDRFVWHIDNGVAAAPVGARKLGFTLQLSDPTSYAGGDLEFAVYSQAYGGEAFGAQREAARQRGAIIVFPAFHLHRVSPVSAGERVAIVGWLHGPRFR